ncbi:hypothetical protein O6H91_07G098600 [Diphasiastrum complanatum]|uniref:Uncharacterized protein n=1 Tax=Diphasiastrum complanatum TaxID=34168 RepID=A0ACC2D7W7_DIPCM|nr:hypothetical protein O6H91_07G098600 [Diphasiastrum complanatum]
MVGIRWSANEGEAQPQTPAVAEGGSSRPEDPAAHFSDDDRSVAADSWSVKSEYGSLMDGDDLLRNADAAEALAVANLRPADYSSDKEEQDVEPSVLGLQSHWDSTYADELANFHEHGDAGEIWFGEEVMEVVADWIARLCASISAGLPIDPVHGVNKDASCKPSDIRAKASEELEWNILDIGTGNGLFLHALAKQGFTDLTGIDYSDAAVVLAKGVAEREGLNNITFLVDDVLEMKLQTRYKLVTDKGTLDAIGLHPEGQKHRSLYWKAVSNLVAPGGLLVRDRFLLLENMNTNHQ